MRKSIAPLLLSAALSVAAYPLTASGEAEFKLDRKAQTISLAKGKWDGKYTFPNVYCTTYPTPAKALSMSQTFYNGMSIYLVEVTYPDNLVAAVAASTIPASLDAKEIVAKILKNESSNETKFKKAGLGYKVSELATSFGRTVSVVATNLAEGSEKEPFPLSRTMITNPPASQPLVSMSAHRLFARGHDRFEVAVYQKAAQPKASGGKAEAPPEMAARLETMADEMVRSLQQCTAAIPARKAK